MPIRVPSMAGITDSLGNYIQGVLGGVVYSASNKLIGGFGFPALVSGALSAALTGAAMRGTGGQMVAISMGFNAGGQLDLLGGLLGGGGGNDDGASYV